jgi:hypothetical protein
MGDHSEAFVGIDTSKLKNAVSVAEAGRNGEQRFLGEFDTTEAATRKLVNRLAAKYDKLTFCYEAGPTGYGLHRLIESLGHRNVVVAPSLIPTKAGDQVKTNRRDANNLARLLRAGELTAVWVPAPDHEAMRDLSRARASAVDDLKGKRQQISSLLLRLGLHFPGKKTWGKAHRNWLALVKLGQREQRFVFEEMKLAERQAQERIDRIEAAIREALPEWSLREVVGALCRRTRADGLPRPGAEGELHRRPGQARRHHQGGQQPGPNHPGRIVVELPSSAAHRAGETGQGRCRARSRARDRVEGTGAAQRPLPEPRPQRQEAVRGGDSRRTRAGRLRVGDRAGGAADIIGRCVLTAKKEARR